MNDVVGQSVIAPSDVDLLALDLVLARMLTLGDGLSCRAKRSNITARRRFRQVHGSGPLPAHEVWQVKRLLCIAPVVLERLNRAN